MDSSFAGLDSATQTLLAHPGVEDGVVLTRQRPEGTWELIAYVVPAIDAGPGRMKDELQGVLRSDGGVVHCVPLSHLPLTGDGRIDHDALTAVPVIDDDLARRWEQHWRAMPGVDQVAVVIQEGPEAQEGPDAGGTPVSGAGEAAAAAAPSDLRNPCVGEAVVTAATDERGDCQLRAYVVGSAGATVRTAELREFLRRHLPVEMIPTAIVLMEALPRTINNKIDRRALVMQSAPAAGEADTGLEPRTPTERRIAAIYQGLLGAEKVGIHERVFDLEGHSLQATQAITRIRETFRVRVPVRTIFELPTVAGMAAHVEGLLILSRREREEIVL